VKSQMFSFLTLALVLTSCMFTVFYSVKGYANEVSVNLLVPDDEEDSEIITEIEKELPSTDAPNIKIFRVLPQTGETSNNFALIGSFLIILGGTLIWLKKLRKNC
jgi:LPXTG-motif cell wall-anchored protein